MGMIIFCDSYFLKGYSKLIVFYLKEKGLY